MKDGLPWSVRRRDPEMPVGRDSGFDAAGDYVGCDYFGVRSVDSYEGRSALCTTRVREDPPKVGARRGVYDDWIKDVVKYPCVLWASGHHQEWWCSLRALFCTCAPRLAGFSGGAGTEHNCTSDQ